MEEKSSKRNRIVVLICLVAVLTVISTLVTLFAGLTLPADAEPISGMKIYVFESDEGTRDLVLSYAVEVQELTEGDVIIFSSTEPEDYGMPRRAEILRIGENAAGVTGFAISDENGNVVTAPYIIGKQVFCLKDGEKIIEFVVSDIGFCYLVLAPTGLLVILIGIGAIKKMHRSKLYKKRTKGAEKLTDDQ